MHGPVAQHMGEGFRPFRTPAGRPIVVATLFLLLSGCAGSPTNTSPVQSDTESAIPTTTETPTPTTTSPPPFEPLATDPQACFDGVCTIRVSVGTSFPLDADTFGLSGFVATAVGPDGVECQLYVRPRGAFTLSLKKPGDSAAGQLDIPTWVTLVSMDGESAVVALGHITPP